MRFEISVSEGVAQRARARSANGDAESCACAWIRGHEFAQVLIRLHPGVEPLLGMSFGPANLFPPAYPGSGTAHFVSRS